MNTQTIGILHAGHIGWSMDKQLRPLSELSVWERQESDTRKSYEAFCVYRDMGGKRSFEKVYQEYAKSIPLLKRWSSEHNWQERVQAWDDYQDSLRQERKLQKRIEIENNVVSDYDFLRKTIEKRIVLHESANYKALPIELNELLLLMRRADDYARRAVGLPDKITESKAEVTGQDGKDLVIKVVYDDSLPSDS